MNLVLRELGSIIIREIPINFNIKTHLDLFNLLRNLNIEVNMLFNQNALRFQLKSKVAILSQFTLGNDLHKLFLICCCSHIKRWKFVVCRRTPLRLRSRVSSTEIPVGVILRVKSVLILVKTLLDPFIALRLRWNRIRLRQIYRLKMGLNFYSFGLNELFL